MSSPVIRKNDDVVYRELGEREAVLLHVKTGQYHGLNETGALIWRLIDGARTADDIACELRSAVDGEAEGLSEDVEAFLAGLRARGLLA